MRSQMSWAILSPFLTTKKLNYYFLKKIHTSLDDLFPRVSECNKILIRNLVQQILETPDKYRL